MEFGGKCILMNDQEQSYDAAKSFCESKGAHLVTILDAAKQQFVTGEYFLTITSYGSDTEYFFVSDCV